MRFWTLSSGESSSLIVTSIWIFDQKKKKKNPFTKIWFYAKNKMIIDLWRIQWFKDSKPKHKQFLLRQQPSTMKIETHKKDYFFFVFWIVILFFFSLWTRTKPSGCAIIAFMCDLNHVWHQCVKKNSFIIILTLYAVYSISFRFAIHYDGLNFVERKMFWEKLEILTQMENVAQIFDSDFYWYSIGSN